MSIWKQKILTSLAELRDQREFDEERQGEDWADDHAETIQLYRLETIAIKFHLEEA